MLEKGSKGEWKLVLSRVWLCVCVKFARWSRRHSAWFYFWRLKFKTKSSMSAAASAAAAADTRLEPLVVFESWRNFIQLLRPNIELLCVWETQYLLLCSADDGTNWTKLSWIELNSLMLWTQHKGLSVCCKLVKCRLCVCVCVYVLGRKTCSNCLHSLARLHNLDLLSTHTHFNSLLL